MIIVSVGIGHIGDIYEPDIQALSRLRSVRAAKPDNVGFGNGRSKAEAGLYTLCIPRQPYQSAGIAKSR